MRFFTVECHAQASGTIALRGRVGDYLRGPVMNTHRRCALITAAIFLSIESSYAGPCSPQIDRMQAGIDAMVAAMAVTGPPGRQSTAAMTHRQPTPSSIAAAGARLDEGERAKRAGAALTRAREADRAGDNGACEQALAEVQRVIDR